MKRLSRISAGCIALVLIATSTAEGGGVLCRLPVLKNSSTCRENAQLKCQVSTMRGEIEGLQVGLADRDAKIAELEATVAEMTVAMTERDAVIADRESQLAEMAKRLDELTEKLATTQKQYQQSVQHSSLLDR